MEACVRMTLTAKLKPKEINSDEVMIAEQYNDTEQKMSVDYKLLIDTAALAGTLMLENGAEIYRVEETINYMLKTSGLKTREAFVVSTGIMISLDDPSIDALTVIRRVNKGATNLNVIAQVNDISRKFYKRLISLEEAFSQLKHLEKTQYPWWLKDICTVFVVASFAGMYGGNGYDMLATAIVGIFLAAWLHIGKKIGLNPLINDLAASVVISVVASIMVHTGIGAHIDRIIIGSIMVLVPGAAITNAIRDTLHGDYASGNANILQAFTEAAMIALGVYVGLLML